MVTKKFKDMEEGDHTMAKSSSGSQTVLWAAKYRSKDDGKTKELMLVDVDNPSRTWRPTPNKEFDVMTDVDEN